MIGPRSSSSATSTSCVNNAGFCARPHDLQHDRGRVRLACIRVHLKGHFCMMRFASELLARAREGDRRQPVYGPHHQHRVRGVHLRLAAASRTTPPRRPAIVAMTHVGARRCSAQYGVTANAIMPRARTRMNDRGPLGGDVREAGGRLRHVRARARRRRWSAWLASPHAANVSGNLIQVWGKHVRIYAAPKPVLDHENEKPWTVDELQKVLGPFFEKRKPIEDSFALPMA